MIVCGNDGREHAMSRTQGGALDGVDGSSARLAAERRQQAAPLLVSQRDICDVFTDDSVVGVGALPDARITPGLTKGYSAH